MEARRKTAAFFYNECDPHLVCLLANLVKKLFACLVQSVVLFASDAWGCLSSVPALDQLQLRSFRSFFGLPRLHPRVPLLVEMDCFSLHWEAKMRCIWFWHKVITHPD